MKSVSKYKLGWIGLRVAKHGKAASALKRAGWIRIGHTELNNRNGWDWILPTVSGDRFDTQDWRPLATKGLEAIAIWFTDAQWGANTGITEYQWRDRRIIESDFNQKWATGKR